MAALRGFSVVQLVGRGGRIRLHSVWRAYSNGTPFSSVPGEPKDKTASVFIVCFKLNIYGVKNFRIQPACMMFGSRFIFWQF